MIISRKRFHEEINKAVETALNEQNERRWLDDRFRDMDRYFDRRMDDMDKRIGSIEDTVFPKKKEECCENQAVACRY